MNHEYDNTDRYSSITRRTRSDWSGICVEDAFRPNVHYVVRSTTRKLFYERVKTAQQEAARIAGCASMRDHTPRVKPQIAPCYTSFPRGAAAVAAIGMSAYLEFIETVSSDLITGFCLADNAELKSLRDRSGAAAETILSVVKKAAHAVEARLFSTCLTRQSTLSSIEVYRLFLASQQNMRFETVSEIIEAVVLYGDLFPSSVHIRFHPVSGRIITELKDISGPYFDLLPDIPLENLVEFGVMWTWDLSRKLVLHLPKESEGEESNKAVGPAPAPEQCRIPPLNQPRQPILDHDRMNTQQRLKGSLEYAMSGKSGAQNLSEEDLHPEVKKSFGMFLEALHKAGQQEDAWQDPRAEMLERTLGANAFTPGPFEGDPISGFDYSVPLGSNETQSGELFECVLDATCDDAAYEQLLTESAPLARQIRKLLYPNVTSVTEMERIKSSGSLDPGRLAMSGFSDAVYRRTLTHQTLDERGKPVLVIAADASSSLRRSQVRMIRILCAAWLQSIRRSRVQLLSCVYHSGSVHTGDSGSLVQWIKHPKKTASRDSEETIRALAGFLRGTGTQADALSIRYIVDEAEKLAAGRMVYLVLLSDAKWNSSFVGGRSGNVEVKRMFESLKSDYSDRLHTTLVVLGDQQPGIGSCLEAVIQVSNPELSDAAAVAGKIARYVAATMKERKKQIQQ
jgi:hypothetical protein